MNKKMNRQDGITSFREEFQPPAPPTKEELMVIQTMLDAQAEHPGKKMWRDYIQAYSYLPDMERAQHKLADSETYRNYCDAMKYGIQIYNMRDGGIK